MLPSAGQRQAKAPAAGGGATGDGVGRGKRVHLLALVIRLGGERAERALHRWIEHLGWAALLLLAGLVGWLLLHGHAA